VKLETHIFALSLTIAFAACAGPQKKEPAKGTADDKTPAAKKENATEVDPTPVKTEGKFDALDHKQRVEFMKTKIVPKMTQVFQTFDAKHFAKVTCVTCHGPGAKQGKFEMPTAALPKLDFSKKDPSKQKWNEFMAKQVVPTMATALGEKPYDPATKKGFGCLSCHMKADAK
jgi:hypothetical protein